ncbi:MAG: FeoB-associated Cys-rich membrane protein [Ruminococcus sp.]|nr:FeoB-associated Cys-rich membrane protein [Candidatus Copronaster equi]
MNTASIIVLVIVIVAVIFAVRRIIKNKGRCSGCNGNCSGCNKANCCDK